MLGNGVLVLLLSMTSLSEASITTCCEQGQKVGSQSSTEPLCVEKNLNYDTVGRVSKAMCKQVFTSCCHYTSMEHNCKAGVGLAINGFQCEKGKDIGGDMQRKCCLCCKEGFLAANRGESCDGKNGDKVMCQDSYKACCNNAQMSLQTTKAPLNQTTAPALDCSTFGCQQKCSKAADGGLKCGCNAGYRLKADQKSCEDIDECAEGTAACGAGTLCQNDEGSYMCIKQAITEKPCASQGYIRNAQGKCVDIDECASGTARCGLGQYCLNTDGYYACFSRCPFGYKAVGNTCEDIDECAIANPCQKNYKCENIRGHYKCKLVFCEKGYKLENNRCTDINECLKTPSVCGKGTCYNTYGSFVCRCFNGYRFNRDTSKCEDIDECANSPGICEAGCVNTEGSHRCVCPSGYKTVSDQCQDIDECALSTNRCPANHVCFNEFGGSTCINSSCSGKYYIQRSPYECQLYCPGNYGQCSNLLIKSIKWRAYKFRKFIQPRGFRFQYTFSVSKYLPVQINFAIVSGNERGDFYLLKQDKNTVNLMNIRNIIGPKRYTLRMETDLVYQGKVTSKYIYFIYISVSKYSF